MTHFLCCLLSGNIPQGTALLLAWANAAMDIGRAIRLSEARHNHRFNALLDNAVLYLVRQRLFGIICFL